MERIGLQIQLIRVEKQIKTINKHLKMMEELEDGEYINRFSLQDGVTKALAIKCLAMEERDDLLKQLNVS